MEKLYCVDYQYTIDGIISYLFRKGKETNILREVVNKFIIASPDTIEEKIKERINKTLEEMKQVIKEEGEIELFDYNKHLYVYIKEIKGFVIENFSYSEATIEECTKNLTPHEYSKLYGDVLMVGSKND